MIGHDPEQVYKAVIVGAGSGGLTAAIGLAGFDHDVVLVEGDRIGGDCTNVGCIPSKSLLHAARTDPRDALAKARSKRDDLEAREAHEMEEDPRIHLVRGWARLTADRGPHVVAVDGPDGPTLVRAEHVVVSGGSRPVEIPIDGLKPERVLTNENLFDLPEPPSTLLIVGGGAIAVEMATAFADLGTAVHVVELQDRLLGTEDPLVSTAVRNALEADGITVHTATTVASVDEGASPTVAATATLADGTVIDGVDKVLMAVGRRPRLDGLGLDVAGVETTPRGVVVDEWGRTSVEGIWAIGDITGATLTTHGANAVGRRVVRSIALPRMPMRGAMRAMPTAIYGRPEVASVGIPIDQLERRSPTGRRRYSIALADVDRGYTDDVQHGLVVVDVERFTGKILRASIVGPSAAELIGIFTLAIDQGIGLRKLFGMVHPYPAYAQAIGQLADDFARATYPRLPKEWWAMVSGRLADRRGRNRS